MASTPQTPLATRARYWLHHRHLLFNAITARVLTAPVVQDRLRRRALRRPDEPGTTIVIVNWNSLEFLAVAVEAVRRFSQDEVRITVVDNGSRDGSRRWLRRRNDVRAILLPANVGHAVAMDFGFLLAKTRIVVALDVDAFPLASTWLPELLGALDRAEVAGVRFNRSYAHPCCMAIRRRRFLEQRHTFVSNYFPEGLGVTTWDVGELISMREQPRVALFEPTEIRGPGGVGMRWGDLVYHNAYSTRHRFHFPDTGEGELDSANVRASDARAAWDEATTSLLGLDRGAREALTRPAG